VGKLKAGCIIPPANTGNAGNDYMSRLTFSISLMSLPAAKN